MQLKFDNLCMNDENIDLSSDEEWSDEEDEQGIIEEENENNGTIVDLSVMQDIKYDFLTVGSFVALPSHTSGFKQFYLVEVVEKGIAEENMVDRYGHAISEREK